MENFHVDMPAIINVVGANKVARQLHVVQSASDAARQALISSPGKLGQAVRAGFARGGLVACAEQASKGNYRPAAEYFAAKTGQPFVISNRSSFDSLPDMFEALIMRAKMAKNGGYVVTKKGETVKSAAHKSAVELQADARYMIERKEEFYAARLAEQAAHSDQPAQAAKGRKPAQAQATA